MELILTVYQPFGSLRLKTNIHFDALTNLILNGAATNIYFWLMEMYICICFQLFLKGVICKHWPTWCNLSRVWIQQLLFSVAAVSKLARFAVQLAVQTRNWCTMHWWSVGQYQHRSSGLGPAGANWPAMLNMLFSSIHRHHNIESLLSIHIQLMISIKF